MAKKVNIIGAGLTGLSAGIYLQQNGIDTEIFELSGWAECARPGEKWIPI